jgi:cob(I)alamin adenosyltransferase
MKIYTKTGEKGDTSLIGGQRVPKTHERLEAYGAVDELNAWIGLIADQDIDDVYKALLHSIQKYLFNIGSHLACPDQEKANTLSQLSANDISLLEQAIDEMDAQLPKLKNFILPGGNTVSSYCQIARTVCRRAERDMLKINDIASDEYILIYINRLSDFLFVLARTFVYEFNGTDIQL